MTDDVRETLAGEGADATPPAGEAREPQAGEAATPAPGAEAAEFKDRWLRAEADLQNARRRAARDREEFVSASENRFLLELVELLDDLERAIGSLDLKDPAQGGTAWVQGVSLTAQRMRDTLARWNVITIPTVGRPFDPNVHEALAEIEAPEGIEPGQVAQEIQRGYRRGERTLRAARVIVAREKS